MREVYECLSCHSVIPRENEDQPWKCTTCGGRAYYLANLATLVETKTTESAKRKGMPLFSGCMSYFPDALLAVSEHSRKANEKHNPGQPLHWSKDKSKDHADCIARHLIDIGPTWDDIDPEFGSYHATALAWRALALLQTVIEREKKKESA